VNLFLLSWPSLAFPIECPFCTLQSSDSGFVPQAFATSTLQSRLRWSDLFCLDPCLQSCARDTNLSGCPFGCVNPRVHPIPKIARRLTSVKPFNRITRRFVRERTRIPYIFWAIQLLWKLDRSVLLGNGTPQRQIGVWKRPEFWLLSSCSRTNSETSKWKPGLSISKSGTDRSAIQTRGATSRASSKSIRQPSWYRVKSYCGESTR
jgi:hypothetical protein